MYRGRCRMEGQSLNDVGARSFLKPFFRPFLLTLNFIYRLLSKWRHLSRGIPRIRTELLKIWKEKERKKKETEKLPIAEVVAYFDSTPVISVRTTAKSEVKYKACEKVKRETKIERQGVREWEKEIEEKSESERVGGLEGSRGVKKWSWKL